MTDIMERIARGVDWLDGARPEWRDALDLSRLDLGSPSRCVLGQVFVDDGAETMDSGFGYAVDNLLVTDDQVDPDDIVPHFGFDIERGEHYRDLTQAWVTYLANENEGEA